MADAAVTLHLQADLPEARIARLTRELGRELARAGIAAETEAAPPAPGERGDPVTLGVLALALIKSGAVVALIRCLQAYLAREPALTIRLRHADGRQVEVTARNVDSAEVRALLDAAAAPDAR